MFVRGLFGLPWVCQRPRLWLFDRDGAARRAGASLEGDTDEDVGELVDLVVRQRGHVQVFRESGSRSR